jgi:DNA-binding transcriptional regulator YhcF (GntR family)
MNNPKEKREKLKGFLTSKGLYKGEDFDSEFNNEETIKSLYGQLINKKAIKDMSEDEFRDKFFGDVLKKKELPQASANQSPKASGSSSSASSPVPAPTAENASSKVTFEQAVAGLDPRNKTSKYVPPTAAETAALDARAKYGRKLTAASEIPTADLNKITPNKLFAQAAQQEGDFSYVIKGGDIDPDVDYNAAELEDQTVTSQRPQNNKAAKNDSKEGLEFINNSVKFTLEVYKKKEAELLKDKEFNSAMEKALELNNKINGLLKKNVPVGQPNRPADVNQYNELVSQYNALREQYKDQFTDYKEIMDGQRNTIEYAKKAYAKSPNALAEVKERVARHKDLDHWFNIRSGIAGGAYDVAVGGVGSGLNKLAGGIINAIPTLLNTANAVTGNEDNEYDWKDRWIEWGTDFAGLIDDHMYPHEEHTLFESYKPKNSYDKPLVKLDHKGDYDGIEWSMVPKMATKVLTESVGMLYGGGVIGGGLKSMGMAGTASEAAGLFSSSYLITAPDYYNQAIEAGMSELDASRFATTSASLTSLLELISPNKVVTNMLVKGGGRVPKEILDSAMLALKSGEPIKVGIKNGFKTVLKEIIPENAQELTQMAGDLSVQAAANTLSGDEYFDIDANKVKADAIETMLLTTLSTGMMTSPAALQVARTVIPYNEAVDLVARDRDKYLPLVHRMIKSQNVNPETAKKILTDIETRGLVFKQHETEVGYYDKKNEVPITKEQAIDAIASGKINEVEAFNDPQVNAIKEMKVEDLLDRARNQPVVEVTQPSQAPAKDLTDEQKEKEIIAQRQIAFDSLLSQRAVLEVTESQSKLLSKSPVPQVRRIGSLVENLFKSSSKLFGEKGRPKLILLKDTGHALKVAKDLGYEMNDDDTVNGWYDRGVNAMFFIPDPNTAIHEALMHPVIDAIKQVKPELYQNFADEIDGIVNPEGKGYADKAKDDGYKGPKISEEAVVNFLSDVAAGKVTDGGIIQRVKTAIRKLLQKVGLSDKDFVINLDNPTTLAQFAGQLADALDNGRAIVFETDKKKATKKKAKDISFSKKGKVINTIKFKPTKGEEKKDAPFQKTSDFLNKNSIASQANQLALRVSQGEFTYSELGEKYTFKFPFSNKKNAKKITSLLNKIDVASTKDKPALRKKLNDFVSEVILDFKEQVKANLRVLLDSATPAFIDLSRKWYEGANRIADEISEKYGITIEQSAAIIAALSPQTEWFNNLSMAERVADIIKNRGDMKIDNKIFTAASRKYAGQPFEKELKASASAIQGKTINEVDDFVLKSIMLRAIDAAQNDPATDSYSPDGEHLGKTNSSVSWGSNAEIAKAIMVLSGAPIEVISQAPKVRSFYNNIVDPFNENPFVTIDTHATSAALMMPLNAGEAGRFGVFNGGENIKNTVIREAYEEVAKEAGLLPRELQSVLWELQRTGLNNVQRTEKDKENFRNLVDTLGELNYEQRAKEIIRRNRSAQSEWARARGIVPQKPDFGWIEENESTGDTGERADAVDQGRQSDELRGGTSSVAAESAEEFPDWVTSFSKVVGEHGGRKIFDSPDSNEYHQAIVEAMGQRTDDALQVDTRSPEYFQQIVDDGGKLFLAEDKSFGAYVTADGYMGGLFKNPKANTTGVAKALQDIRVKNGGKWFDAYGTHLEDIYIKNGFRPVARIRFHEEFAPNNWRETNLKGRPDVVLFAYDPNGAYQKGDGTYFNSFDQAENAVKQFVNGQQRRNEETLQRDGVQTENGRGGPLTFSSRSGESRTDNSGVNERAEGQQGRSGSDLSQSSVNNSTTTQKFFSDTVKGANQPKAAWKPVMAFNAVTSKLYDVWRRFQGNFDNHIDTNIPAFRDIQLKKMAAILNVLKGGGLVIDLGGSEGGFIKTITSENPSIKGINLDLNPDMEEAHNRTPVAGAKFIREAFAEDVDMGDYIAPRHQPSQKADVVHESMMFQFIKPDRKQFIDEVANHYIKPDGVLVLEEKVIVANEQEWLDNERKKDSDFKSQYYNSQAIKEKQEKVVVGMKGNQAEEAHLIAALKSKFAHVAQYWDSGNFKGYLASNNKAKLDAMLKAIGDTRTEYSTRETGVSFSRTQAILEKDYSEELLDSETKFLAQRSKFGLTSSDVVPTRVLFQQPIDQDKWSLPNSRTTTKDVAIDQIRPTDLLLRKSDLFQQSSSSLPKLLKRKDGRYSVIDGHHRIVRAMISGDTKIEAEIFTEREPSDVTFSRTRTETTERVVEPLNSQYQSLRQDYLNNPNDPKFTAPRMSIKDKLEQWKSMDDNAVMADLQSAKSNELFTLIDSLDGKSNFSLLGLIEILNRANTNNDTQTIDWAFEKLNRIGSGVGQLLRQMRELKSIATSPNAPRATKIKMNRGLVKSAILKYIEKQGIVLTVQQRAELDNIVNTYVVAHANEFDALEKYNLNPTAQNYARYEQAVNQTDLAHWAIEEFIQNVVPSGLGNLISTIIKGNLLTAGSVVVNTSGNILNVLNTAVEGSTVPIARSIYSLAGNPNGAGIGSVAAGAIYASKAFARAWVPATLEAFKRGGLRTKEMSKFEVSRQLHPFRAWKQLLSGNLPKRQKLINGGQNVKIYTPVSAYVEKFMEGTFGIPAAFFFRMLYITDKPFKEGARTFAATQVYSEENGGKIPSGREILSFMASATPAQKDKFEKYANKFTYNDNQSAAATVGRYSVGIFNTVAETVEKRGLSNTASFVRLLGTTVNPYVIVPSNIIQQFLELAMPPLAIAGAVHHYKEGNKQIGDQLVGRAVAGTMLYMLSSALYAAGLLISGDDDASEKNDKSLKHQFAQPLALNVTGLSRYLNGEQDFGYQDGDTSVNLQKLGIAGVFMGFFARWSDQLKEARMLDEGWGELFNNMTSWPDAAGAGGRAMYKTAFDMSFFHGQMELMKAIQSDGEQGASFAKTMVAQNIETASNLLWANQFSQIAQGIDADVMKRASDPKLLGNIQERLAKRKFMFGIISDSELYPVLDLWGQPVKSSLSKVADPFKIDKAEDPAAVEIWNLIAKTGNDNPISIPQGRISSKRHGEYKLEESDYLILQGIAGKIREANVKAAMKSDEYIENDDSGKLLVLKEANDNANKLARKIFKRLFEEEINSGNIVLDKVNETYEHVVPHGFQPERVEENLPASIRR